MGKVICIEGSEKIKKSIKDRIVKIKNSNSMWEKDRKRKEEGENKVISTYTDGSAKNGKAGAGIWNKDIRNLKYSIKAWGTQDSYNAELQGAIYAITNSPKNCEHKIHIDNAAVVGLGNKIIKKERIVMKECPQPQLTRLLIDEIERKAKEKVKIEIIKVKGHSGLERNEEADERAKEGREKSEEYIRDEDVGKYKNEFEIWYKGNEIRSKMRENIKEINLNKRKEDAKTDRNIYWKNVNNTESNVKLSNSLLKNRKIDKKIVGVIIKGRTDLLPHAKELFNRKCQNINLPMCPWCEASYEDTEHILINCGQYKKVREDTKIKIIEEIIKAKGYKMDTGELDRKIPSWFSEETICNIEDKKIFFKELVEFDKVAGALGYVPKNFRKTISNLAYPKINKMSKEERKRRDSKVNKLINKIYKIVIKGTYKIWTTRNKRWKEEAELLENRNDIRKKEKEKIITEIKEIMKIGNERLGEIKRIDNSIVKIQRSKLSRQIGKVNEENKEDEMTKGWKTKIQIEEEQKGDKNKENKATKKDSNKGEKRRRETTVCQEAETKKKKKDEGEGKDKSKGKTVETQKPREKRDRITETEVGESSRKRVRIDYARLNKEGTKMEKENKISKRKRENHKQREKGKKRKR